MHVYIYIYYLSWLRLEYLIKSNGDIGNEEYIHQKKPVGFIIMSCIVTYLNYNTWQTCVCACMHHTMCELDSMLYCLSFVHACIKIFIISQVHGCTYQVCVHICMNKMFSDTFMNNDIDRYMVAVALVKNATHMQTCFISNAYTLPYLFLNSNLAIEVLQV